MNLGHQTGRGGGGVTQGGLRTRRTTRQTCSHLASLGGASSDELVVYDDEAQVECPAQLHEERGIVFRPLLVKQEMLQRKPAVAKSRAGGGGAAALKPGHLVMKM